MVGFIGFIQKENCFLGPRRAEMETAVNMACGAEAVYWEFTSPAYVKRRE